MSLQNLFSFEHIATADIGSLPRMLSAQATILPNGGRDNSACININNQNGLMFTIDPWHDVTIGAWVLMDGSPGVNGVLWQFGNPDAFNSFVGANLDACHVTLQVMLDGALRVRQAGGDGTPIIATSAPGLITFGPAHPVYIEMRAVIGATGSVVVRVNEAEVINVASVDTMYGSNNLVTFIRMRDNGIIVNFDDVYVVTGQDTGDGWTGFQGILKIKGLLANAAGDRAEWTPSVPSGVNWQNVDEAVPNITDYNDALTVGLVDLYHLEDVGFDPKAIEVDLYVRKLEAGPSSINHVLRLGGADTISTEALALTTSFRYYKKTYTTAPGVGAWTMLAYNALQAGPRKAV